MEDDPDQTSEAAARGDRSLVERFVREGDPEAFNELVARYKDQVYRLALSILGSIEFAADAEDVAQDVFFEMYRHLHHFRGDCRFSTWLYRVTVNRALDVKGRRRFSAPHLSEDALRASGTGEAGADDRLARKEIRAAIAELPAMHQAAINLHYWMGYSVNEIATELGCSPNTVKSYLFRARKTLLGLLDGVTP